MALNDDIQLLSQLPLFNGMSEDQLRLIAFGADRRVISNGQMLFRESSPADSAYVIVNGSVELSRTGRNGQPEIQAVVGTGTLLSELALITLVERKFTAIAKEDTAIIRITRSLFHRLIEEYPDAALLIEKRIRENIAALAARAAAELHRFA
ncbi:cyclic nucleotide-binding domain-containing protein [Rhizobium sp. 18055]|jgi:CRP-like cAMP-binding protein|uniref:cyclic nucleotide-binding domain-containing protein n=1 Tax=Rhizobium sp. 18055 TaxID=2681403 RepID=UPI00135AEE9B|nr:cyclic nucleotide-binding domain-containing protein [Rhizobium sp. 18055]